ncbi:MAG: hypothetical protein COA52_00990 [Hyphomicrobiales bacterium]|nr:MAG: hypothetical protein COA52_00990 [Hyphomicrobiales bacterium]
MSVAPVMSKNIDWVNVNFGSIGLVTDILKYEIVLNINGSWNCHYLENDTHIGSYDNIGLAKSAAEEHHKQLCKY